jgi:hypothetical protein
MVKAIFWNLSTLAKSRRNELHEQVVMFIEAGKWIFGIDADLGILEVPAMAEPLRGELVQGIRWLKYGKSVQQGGDMPDFNGDRDSYLISVPTRVQGG